MNLILFSIHLEVNEFVWIFIGELIVIELYKMMLWQYYFI
uniref:Uncharacterized protein n=1 Tax=Pseudoalteromonas luteoviolacea TaxID=43657 RepID=A0A023PYM4_9GAMM|nr:hypothetical protein [Pseudoalteromonas luteoviolacea]